MFGDKRPSWPARRFHEILMRRWRLIAGGGVLTVALVSLCSYAPTMIYWLAIFIFAVAFLPDPYRPTWIHRPDSWQVVIGLLAVLIATAIVMTPEFYALGLLGDSTFFDFLVLAISFQLRGLGERVGRHALSGFARIRRLMGWSLRASSTVLLFTVAGIIAAVHKVAQRIAS